MTFLLLTYGSYFYKQHNYTNYYFNISLRDLRVLHGNNLHI